MVKRVEGYLFGASGRRPRALGVSVGRLPFHVVRVVCGIWRRFYFADTFRIFHNDLFRVRSRSYRSPMSQIIVFNDSPLPVQLLDGYCLYLQALLITLGTSKESPSLRLLRDCGRV